MIEPINWNKIEDPVDLDVWTRLTNNFWLDTKIPLSNDLPSWRSLSDDERTLLKRVFVGLTALDTLQGHLGAPSLVPDARTPHEKAVLNNIAFMEEVHAKSYSSIFSTLCSTEEINEAFLWANENKNLNYKSEVVERFYRGGHPLKRKAASTLLESLLFFSGFYAPFYFASRGKLTNTGDIISLILRDESVHGYYIGYKYQLGAAELPTQEQIDLEEDVYDLLVDLMDNEIEWTRPLYDPLGLTADVTGYLKYNANKALMNLGYDALYAKEETNFDASIKAYLDPTSNQNHDFFSGAGSSYQMVDSTEVIDDDDWAF